VLGSQLRTIQRSRKPSEIARAREIATGGGGLLSLGGRLMGGVAAVLGAPMRAVVATGEEAIEAFSGEEDDQSWWENFSDPNYGVGRVVERYAPDANIWVKRAAGLTGDILLDPLTYLTFGASPALQALGKGAGLQRVALDAALHYGDDSLKQLAAKAGRAAYRMTDDELDAVAKASTRMAEEGVAGAQAIGQGQLRYGINVRMPFTRTTRAKGFNAVAIRGPQAAESLAPLRRLREGRVGKGLGGSLAKARVWAASGDPQKALYGRRVLDAEVQGSGAMREAEQFLGQLQRDYEATGRKLGLEGKQITDALRLRPSNGPAYANLDDAQRAFVDDLANHMDELVDWSAERAAVGTGKDRVITRFIKRAPTERGGYVPRVMTDEFKERVGIKGKQRVKTGDRSWIERHGLSPGEADAFEEKFGVKLAEPGTVVDEATGEVAGAVEDQIEAAARAAFGDEYVPWYKEDFYEILPTYHNALASQIRNYKRVNYLYSKGVATDLLHWMPGESGITVKNYAKVASQQLDQLDGQTAKALGRLDSLNRQVDEARAAVADRRLSVQEYEEFIKRLEPQRAAARTRLHKVQDKVDQAAERLAADTEARLAADDAYEAADQELADINQRYADLQVKMDNLLGKAQREGGNAWRQLRDLEGELAEIGEARARVALAQGRVGKVMERAVNNYAVANDLASLIDQGIDIAPGDPFYEFVEDTAARYFPAADDPNEVLPNIVELLRGQADQSMDELAGYAPPGEFPTTTNPQQLAGEIGGAKRRQQRAAQAMTDATDEQEFQAARAAYEQESRAMEHRRALLSLHRAASGGLTVAGLDEFDQALLARSLDLQNQITAAGVTPQERASMLFDYQREQWRKQAGDPQPFPNPGTGGTWYHGVTDAPVDVDGQFKLDHQLDKMAPTWGDYLFSPSLTADPAFARAWAETNGLGDPRAVQEIILNTRPERVRVFGLGGDANDLSRIMEPTGEINPAVGQEMIGEAMAQERMLDVVPGENHLAGQGMDIWFTDMVERMADERPDLMDDLLDVLRNPSTEGRTIGGVMQTALQPQVPMARLADTLELAQSIRAVARGQGEELSFADALEAAGQWTLNRGAEAGDFALDLVNPGFLRGPVDGYRPMAARIAVSLQAGAVDPGWVRQYMEFARDSYARDYDVIALANVGGPLIGYDNAFLHAVPTNQFTITPAGFPEDLWSGPMRSAMASIGEAKRTFAGKYVNMDAYNALHAELGQMDEATRAVNDQFTARSDDLVRAQAMEAQARKEYEQALASEARHLATSEEKYMLLTRAREAAEARGQMLTEAEARVTKLEQSARELEAQLVGQTAQFPNLLRNVERAEDALTKTLRQGWEGFGFGRQAPSEVVELIADIAKSYDQVSGEGLREFLKGFDHVNNWMKGWLTASPGFQWRNIFGGMFNNWLAGADVTASTLGWARIYQRMRPRRVARNIAAGKVTPGEQAMYTINSRLGLIGAGLHHSEISGAMSPSANPFAGITGSGKAPLPAYLTKRMGEQTTEPILRGSLGMDRVQKALRQGRFRSIGIDSLDDVTAENMGQFVDEVLASSLSDEIMADVNKYHFDYDDLSRFERQVGRRIIPFYTWTRKNVPLQLEAMLSQPGKSINRYMALKRNLELGQEEEPIVPSYFKEQGFIQLPFLPGGNQAYGTVDLPFRDPFEVADVSGQLLGMVNPMLKAPVEAWAGKQFFSDVPIREDYINAPGAWTKIPGLMQAWQLAGQLPLIPLDAPIKRDGTWYVRDRDAHLMQQYMPFMYQARRLLPFWDEGESNQAKKYQNRLTTTFLSYLGGVNVRTNTPGDMEAEIFRRADALERIADDLRATGGLPRERERRQPRRRGQSFATLVANLASTEEAPPTEGETPAYQG
jgi:hypothetical protein